MIPVFVVIGFLLVKLLLGWEAGRAAGFIGAGVGILFLATSTVLSLGLPVRTLPAPDGPGKAGVVTINREYIPDSDADGDPAQIRRLQLKVWYPAAIEDGKEFGRETVWSEFNSAEYFSAIERFFTAYLKNMKTHSFLSPPMAVGGTDRPVLIYNHALLSIASDSFLLMESLASHGYVIIAIRHKDQRGEYALLHDDLSDEEKAKEVENFKKLGGKDLERDERSAVSLQVYRDNNTLPVIVKRRAKDTGFVLDNLDSILKDIPGCTEGRCADNQRIGIVGLSLGGAVATEFCKADPRCAAAVNLDGGIFGTNIEVPVQVPYLMLYSERNEGGNDFAKTGADETYEDYTISGAEHLNFADASVVLPGLRYIRLLGSIDGEHMNRERNLLVRDFLDRQL
nr:hypothetical protein [Hoeflea prorocentri]